MEESGGLGDGECAAGRGAAGGGGGAADTRAAGEECVEDHDDAAVSVCGGEGFGEGFCGEGGMSCFSSGGPEGCEMVLCADDGVE